MVRTTPAIVTPIMSPVFYFLELSVEVESSKYRVLEIEITVVFNEVARLEIIPELLLLNIDCTTVKLDPPVLVPLVPFELSLSRIIACTIVDPETTPTIFTLEVSVMPSKAHRLEMKLLSTLLLKNSVVFIAK